MQEEDVSGLEGLFDGTIVRILDFLLIHKGFDYSKTEIAENSGIGYKTLFEHWGKIEHYGLVKETRKIGRATLYQINKDSPIVKALKKLQRELMFHDAEITAKEEIAKEEAKTKKKPKEAAVV
jgi:DNA-binding transcriptional ArsR family regulator